MALRLNFQYKVLSAQLLRFHPNFTGVISAKSSCVYHQNVPLHCFQQSNCPWCVDSLILTFVNLNGSVADFHKTLWE